MTTQSVIMNSNGISMASDSKVTVKNNKTYIGAEKIFELNREPGIAMMISGSAYFGEIPIETLVSKFKKSADISQMTSIMQIKEEFLKYLAENTPKVQADEYIRENLILFKKEVQKNLNKVDKDNLDDFMKNVEEYKILRFIEDYKNFDDEFKDIIPNSLSNEKAKMLNVAIWKEFSDIFRIMETRIFLCGYNRNDNYPSFEDFTILLNNNGKIEGETLESVTNSSKPCVKTFAQSEGSDIFINGISDDFEKILCEEYDYLVNHKLDVLFEIIKYSDDFDRKTLNQIGKIISSYKLSNNYDFKEVIEMLKKSFEENFLDYISLMPKGLLCEYSEALIYNTELKQKASSKTVTVGGPRTVILITIKDGLVWMNNNI